jgi:hypothetical protein
MAICADFAVNLFLFFRKTGGSVAKKELFYVDVEERSFITLAIEAEDDAEAEDLAEAYVTANVLPSEMYLSDRTAIAYSADEQPAMALSAISITREVDPASAMTRDLKRTVEGYIGWQGLSTEEILGAAQTALDDLKRVLTAQPTAKMGM